MRLFSGIQPTGSLHLGNYLGALRQWVSLQATYECFFCIVDLHALTVPPVDPKALEAHVRMTLATYLGAGIDPKQSVLFVQSTNPLHSHGAWLLGCMTSLGWLNRMTQFKDKKKCLTQEDQATLGLYAYPVLMAADVLVYGAHKVPVGHDQLQHVELMRDIAMRANHLYGDIFTIPEAITPQVGARIMSLKDGRKKMSKSDPTGGSRLELCESNDAWADKIKRAKTDSLPLPEDHHMLAERPEALNLVTILAALTGSTPQHVCNAWAGKGFMPLKAHLAEVVIESLGPLRDRIAAFLQDPHQLDCIASAGAEKAYAVALPMCQKLQEVLGLAPLWQR